MKRHFLFDTGMTSGGGATTTGTAVENQLVGQATPEQIAAWKAQYKMGIYSLTDDDGLHVGYFKNPSRQEVNCALASANKTPLGPAEELAKLTFIGGSEALLNDDAMSLGTTEYINKKMNGVKLRMVNL